MKTTFLFNFRAARLIFDRKHGGAWMLKFVGGRGPGYMGRLNFAAWIGNNVAGGKRLFRRERRSVDMYLGRFSAGITRNGNDVPWVRS